MEINVNLRIVSAPDTVLGELLSTVKALKIQGDHIMSAISDFAAKQTAHYADISSKVDDIGAEVANLNAQIATLQNSAGTLSADDQATLDALEATGAAAQAKVDALAPVVAAPPTPPADQSAAS